jgi:hypothetical protein
MLRELVRSSFSPRAPRELGSIAVVAEPPPSRITPAESGTQMQIPSSPPVVPTVPPPSRRNDAANQADPAQAKYESLKQLIHTRLVDRLDMNRIADIDPKALRDEIRNAPGDATL